MAHLSVFFNDDLDNNHFYIDTHLPAIVTVCEKHFGVTSKGITLAGSQH